MRKAKRIRSRDLANNGMVFTLSDADRRDAGAYQCTATNGVGEDAVETINVQVLCEYSTVYTVAPISFGKNKATASGRIHFCMEHLISRQSAYLPLI